MLSVLVVVAILSPGAAEFVSASPVGERLGPTQQIVAISDIHGALEPFLEILRETNLVDRRARWSGGTATLVQAGDFLDRGDQALAVAHVLMRLQNEAERARGRIIVLLGNHQGDRFSAIYVSQRYHLPSPPGRMVRTDRRGSGPAPTS